MRIFWAIALTLVSSTALSAQAPSAEERQRNALAASIRAEAEKFIAALSSRDGGKFRDLFWEDITYVDGGRIYPSREALVNAASGFFRGQRSIGGSWEPVHVNVLGPNAGVFTGVFNAAVVDTAGRRGWLDGKIWTLVYERRNGAWRIVQAHEANRRP